MAAVHNHSLENSQLINGEADCFGLISLNAHNFASKKCAQIAFVVANMRATSRVQTFIGDVASMCERRYATAPVARAHAA